jgi:hypothetical protein
LLRFFSDILFGFALLILLAAFFTLSLTFDYALFFYKYTLISFLLNCIRDPLFLFGHLISFSVQFSVAALIVYSRKKLLLAFNIFDLFIICITPVIALYLYYRVMNITIQYEVFLPVVASNGLLQVAGALFSYVCSTRSES